MKQTMNYRPLRPSGDFDGNPFVRETLAHIERKTCLGDELLLRLEEVRGCG